MGYLLGYIPRKKINATSSDSYKVKRNDSTEIFVLRLCSRISHIRSTMIFANLLHWYCH